MTAAIVFSDRVEAGRRLGTELVSRPTPADAIVCGIPRGGVVVAAEVARALARPLRAVVARKVGAPGHEELAVGAVGPDGVAVLDEDLLRRLGADRGWIENALERARAEVSARVAEFPGVVTAPAVRGCSVIVVDDGVATGSTAAAVGRWLGHAGATHRLLALPVGPPDTLEQLRADYDEVLALAAPAAFMAVGQFYRNFTQTTDDEVRRLLGG
ncbi:MAG: phosphoribosyltransferase family protein [Acidimicrobiia bacterium]